MKDFLLFLPITALYLAIKSSATPWLPLDLILIITIHLAITRPTAIGVLLVFVLGYMEDSFMTSHVGTSSIALIVTYLSLHLFSHKLQIRGANSLTLMVLSYSLAKSIIIVYVLSGQSDLSLIYKSIIPIALLTGLVAPFITNLLARLDEWFDLNNYKGSLH